MEKSSALVSALIKILTPLVKILLRNGISYGSFAEVAKKIFVDVAMNEFTIEGRKQTMSRVSVITGLNRKEVKRQIESDLKQVDAGHDERYNRAARVIAGWRREAAYRKGLGLSSELPVEGEGKTFASLVRRYSGDMPVRAILDELERIGAVVRTSEGHVRLRTRYFLPQTDTDMKLHILGTDVGHLISTIGLNMGNAAQAPHLQRKVSYDNLPLEAIEPFRKISKAQAQNLLENLDEYLSQYDRDTNSDVEGTGRYIAGIGIYYFEEANDDEPD